MEVTRDVQEQDGCRGLHLLDFGLVPQVKHFNCIGCGCRTAAAGGVRFQRHHCCNHRPSQLTVVKGGYRNLVLIVASASKPAVTDPDPRDEPACNQNMTSSTQNMTSSTQALGFRSGKPLNLTLVEGVDQSSIRSPTHTSPKHAKWM